MNTTNNNNQGEQGMSNGEKVARYDVYSADNDLAEIAHEQCDDGPWVKYEDYAEQASTIVALKEREMGLEAALGIASKAAAALKEQLAAARNDALEEAAKVSEVLTRIPSDLLGLPPEWMARTAGAGARIAAAIRALASQPAAPVQPNQREKLLDESAERIKALNDSPPVQQPGDVRGQFEAWARKEFLCRDEEIRQTADGYYSVERLSAAWRAWQDCSALATTRPSSALTETQQRGLSALADRIEQAGNALPLFIDTTAAIAIRAILAASSGAVAVPEDELKVTRRGDGAFVLTGSALKPGHMYIMQELDSEGESLSFMTGAAPATPAQGQTK